MGDGKYTGLETGLSVAQFANAVFHSLACHATKHLKGGIMLPIDDKRWQQVFMKEFPKRDPVKRTGKPTQDLSQYCGYYSRGEHGLGYDRNGKFDFGEGSRGDKNKGNPAKRDLVIREGTKSVYKPVEVIKLAKKLWKEFQAKRDSTGNSNARNRIALRRKNDDALEPGLRKAARELKKSRFFEHVTDEDERISRPILMRRGQPDFRKALIAAYGGRCAISGCDAVSALEAAHIVPFSEARSYRVSHGLLLRADIHTLFDLDLLAIDPETRKIVLACELNGTSYDEFVGRSLAEPTDERSRADMDALRQKWDEFNAANRTC